MRETHRTIAENWKCTNLNLWFGFNYNRNHPLLADDCKRVCAPLGLDWIAVFVIGSITTRSFTDSVEGVDAFLSGNRASVQEQLAAVAKTWKEVKSIEELPNISNKILAQFDIVYPLACNFLDRMAAQEKPRPLPEPPPPAPPKPTPTEPIRRPDPTPQPKPDPDPKPNPDPKPPKKSGSWTAWILVVTGVMGAVGWLVKAFLPGWAILIWDTVKTVLEAIAAGMANLF